MLKMTSAGYTDTGRVRAGNEDAFLVREPLLIVADGMGGAAAGEVASSIAVRTVDSIVDGKVPASFEAAEDILRSAIREADERIRSVAEQNPKLSGMGTTVLAAFMVNERLVIGWVGDSRAYLITGRGDDGSKRGKQPPVNPEAQTVILKTIDPGTEPVSSPEISRVTDDHSVVMSLVQAGVITEKDIRTHPLRNRITRCVGSIGGQEPEFTTVTPRSGDVLILCSDGLWEMMHEDLILAVTSSTPDPDEMCRRLISAANDAGGHDNITVIAAIFRE